MTEETKLTIGQVAEKAGVATSAIRYYERVGVLPQPERESGQRRYGEDTVQRLEVLGVAQKAGFSLDEVKTLFESADRGEPAHRKLRALVERKLPEVNALIARAQRVRAWLDTATACSCETLDDCSLFVTFDPIGDREDAIELNVIRPAS
jgi:MerR family transcriptional regulator, redox-sensitive transcriptional activator SoxR